MNRNQKSEVRSQWSEARSRRLRSIVFCLLFSIFCLCYLVAQVRDNHRLNNQLLNSPAPQLLLSDVIKDDWLVNDDTLGGCDQLEPSITSTKTGYILVWIDYRNGHDPDIYTCRFDFGGVPIDSAIRVNDDTGGSYQGTPSVDADSAGNFVVVWEDNRNGQVDIYGQRYNKHSVPIGSNFRIDDDASGRNQYTPVVGVGLGGAFIVAWRDDRGSAPDIYAQIYDASGSPTGNNFVVNDDGVWNAFQVFPSVSKTPNNEFAVVWLDTYAGLGIYCQRFTYWGAPIGSNFEVTDNADSTAPMRLPFISSNLISRTVIVWRDHREHDSYPNVYAQQYDSLWNPVGTNFRVNDDTIFAWHDAPSVMVDSAGYFVAVWSDGRQNFSSPDVYGQRYDAMGNPQGWNFRTNEFSPGSQESTLPVVGVDIGGSFIIVWQDNSGKDRELLAKIYYTLVSVPARNNFSIIPDEGMSNQKTPEIAMNIKGNFVIAWEDSRGESPTRSSIFAQRYDADGNPLGVNWQVNGTSKIAKAPSIAIDSAGNFVIVWTYDTPSHIYGCKYTSSCIPMTSEFQVDSGTSAIRVEPSVAMDEAGNFVVAWQDYRNDTKYADIYAQRYTTDCTPIGSNFKVDQFVGESSESPCVAMDSDGDFVIVWQEGRVGLPLFDIYGQKFDSAGSPVGVNFQISDAPMAQHQQIYPSITLHKEGNFVVVWQDTRDHTDGNYDIYAQVYDANGLPVGTNFKINDDSWSVSHELPSVTFHPGTKEFIAIWTDYRETNPQIMAQKFDSLGLPLDVNFQINNPDVHLCNYHLSSSRSIASNEERVTLAWTDNRRLKSWDIYAKLVKWEFTGTEEVAHGSIPRPLLQVYPTPAFKNLTVKYTIPSTDNRIPITEYRFLIYDIAGRISTEFTLPERAPGVYTSHLDISTFNSGIYFLKFKTPHITPITEKIIVCH